MSTAAPRLSTCSGRSNWPEMLDQSPCGSRIANGTKHAAATTANEATAARRRAAAAAAPEVDDREREQDARPELRGEAEPEQRAGEDRPLVDERRQAAEREQRRPEVVARAEQRAEHERRDGEEEQRRPDPAAARADPPQRRRDAARCSRAPQSPMRIVNDVA